MGTGWGNLLGGLLALASLGAVLGAAESLRRARRSMLATVRPPRPADERLGLYELAYLSGGASRVACVALVRMHRGRRLVVERHGPERIALRPVGGGPRDDMEALALETAAKATDGDGRAPWPLFPSGGDSRMRELRDRLVVEGLLNEGGFPDGVLRRAPTTESWLRARTRYRTLVARLPAAVVAGAVLAVALRSYLPLLVYPPLLWWARAVRDRDEEPYSTLTAAGRAAVEAAGRADWIRRGEPAWLREVAVLGRDALSARHPLHRPAPPPRPRTPAPEPEPEPVVVYEGPGLGGL
ncbi:TIGR04222 domain-containing membrane protein [Streptomyces sp. NPDC002057]|uniref:TIGR04222 domain-containing membrane protein n=1 Tax=Streptomyces sp. NPDC002057 TaxID=3154664 RepID=UPI00332B4EEF